MGERVLSNGLLQVAIGASQGPQKGGFFVKSVELKTSEGWKQAAWGTDGEEFSTTLGKANGTDCRVSKSQGGDWTARLSCTQAQWQAEEVVTLASNQPVLQRRQTYRFPKACEAAVHPGFRVKADADIRYTFPLRAHEKPLAGVPALRSAVDWALPFPFHVWHNRAFVAMYGLDKSLSAGTLELVPAGKDGYAGLRVYYPDTGEQRPQFFGSPAVPGLARFQAGAEVTLTEIFAAKPLAAGDEPLLEAERIAASILLREPPRKADLKAVASGIVGFYKHCELWEPNAFGAGRGWFTNMWVRTQTGPAKKRGEMSGYFDLGWGEGIAVEMWMGAVRHWKRTGNQELLPFVDEMARNMELFKRGSGAEAPYFDRSDGKRFGDFLMDHVPGSRIWTHSLGHIGSQLIQLYETAPDYPKAETRGQWLAAARSIGAFLARHQRADGDLQDIFDAQDKEVNTKPHRITARAVVCGLWARLGRVTGDNVWAERALRLARAVAPEISRYEFYNQMLDGLAAPGTEFADGEAAYYVLEGLVPLFAATRNPDVLALCKKAAAFGISWTYFYNVPKAHNGIARGGQCCRMDDFPLLYPIGPAKAMEPLLSLAAAAGDSFFEQMAAETAAFIGNWQMRAPGKPWDGGMIHALAQYCGKHWGPALAGQVDTGMATGNSLAAIELWLAH